MSAITSNADLRAGAGGDTRTTLERLRSYLWSDNARRTQTVLALIWLLDGGLQFQSFMYGKGFIQLLLSTAAGEPGWVVSSVHRGAVTMQSHQVIFNTGAALIQVVIGVAILYRPTVKPALILSFAWSLAVWWFGNAFGGIFIAGAMPLTGAPGAVLLYGVIGAVAWPSGRPGGLFGVRGARVVWAVLWGVMAYLWLLAASSSPNAIHDAIAAAPSGMGWLSSVESAFASITKGNGEIVAFILAAGSAAIAVAVARDWRAKEFLLLAAGLNLIYWVVGQGLGGIFAGGATDPNAGPLFILLAYAMYPMAGQPSAQTVASDPPRVTSPAGAPGALA